MSATWRRKAISGTVGHEAAIIAAYKKGGKDATLRGIARGYGVSPEAIRKVLRKADIVMRPQGRAGLTEEQIATAIRLYRDEKKSTHTISREFGCGQETVRAALVRAGEPLRSPSEAISATKRRRNDPSSL